MRTFEPADCYGTGYCFVHKGWGQDECLPCTDPDASCDDLTAPEHFRTGEDAYAITKAQCTLCNDEFAKLNRHICYYDEDGGVCRPQTS